MSRTLEADYLVVGAGAMSMAFADALIDNGDVSVIMLDRRPGAGGHWLDAYSFVRLHQASVFYGVASTPLGHARIQQEGPEAGLHERATATEVCSYYNGILRERMMASGKVSFYPNSDYVGEGGFVSRSSGERFNVNVRRKIVDGRYLSPTIPATMPPPFAVDDGVRVIPVNQLVEDAGSASQYVIVGSGKTATDACVWLLQNGVDANAICWVRPREPWMLNRAVLQPDPAVFVKMSADTMQAAAEAESADDLFVRLEDAGVMLRIDRSVTPTMAKTPTLAEWELDYLRTIDNVVRGSHIRRAAPGRLIFDDRTVTIAQDALIVHCAASGIQYPPLVPIWGDGTITLQPIRAGFPCFAGALTGYVEATRNNDIEKNRLCPPSPLPNTPTDWARMQVLGSRAVTSFNSEPDIKAWANGVLLNPARIPAERTTDKDVLSAQDRLRTYAPQGMARLKTFASMTEGVSIM